MCYICVNVNFVPFLINAITPGFRERENKLHFLKSYPLKQHVSKIKAIVPHQADRNLKHVDHFVSNVLMLFFHTLEIRIRTC